MEDGTSCTLTQEFYFDQFHSFIYSVDISFIAISMNVCVVHHSLFLEVLIKLCFYQFILFFLNYKKSI